MNAPASLPLAADAGRPLCVGAIASLKRGLEHFIDRELLAARGERLRDRSVPREHRPGLYNPRPSWRFHPWTVALWVLLAQPLRLLAGPRAYLRTLGEALAAPALGEFLLGRLLCTGDGAA